MARLNQRQLLIAAAAVVLTLATVQWVVRPVMNYRERLARNVVRTEQRLHELLRLEKAYRKARAEYQASEKNVRNRPPGFTLFAFLENLAGRDGLKEKIEYMRPSVKPLDEEHQQEQVEMRLKGISLKGLIPYLYHIETAPEQVRIERLSIRPEQRQRALLDVNLVIVARGYRGTAG
ncbi:MAG: type II secretion system protein M [Deltaproteobacteria bacterium]|nr:type II secretion system protein M [Deltaproteobacteria bacterium]MBW2071652.1 type II secretion system protein M [Deltaproteobacteria bacterium]